MTEPNMTHLDGFERGSPRIGRVWKVTLCATFALTGAILGVHAWANLNLAPGDLLATVVWGAAAGLMLGVLFLPLLAKVCALLPKGQGRPVPVPYDVLLLGAMVGAAEGATVGVLCGQVVGAVNGTSLGWTYGMVVWALAWRVRRHTHLFILSLVLSAVVEAAGGLCIAMMAQRFAANAMMAWVLGPTLALSAGMALARVMRRGYR